MAIKLEVWGDYALFTRPEMKVERVSYDIMTPSAARGILEAIYWHPGLKWIIDQIDVLSPIVFTNVRRNEVKSVVSARTAKGVMEKGTGELYLNTKNDIVQRASMLLKDVHYVIKAHFEMTENASESDNPGKFQDIVSRRIQKGQCYHQPYFGCREFPVSFCEAKADTVCPDELKGTRDLGYMLYDMDYSDGSEIKPMFFRAIMVDGKVRIPDVNSGEVIM